MWRGNREPKLVTVDPNEVVTMPRRTFFKLAVVGAHVAIADHLPADVEQLANSPTVIGTLDGQDNVRSASRSICFPPQDARDSKSIAIALKPSLKRFGPGMYVRLSNNGYDEGDLEEELYRKHDETGMEYLTVFAGSNGGNLEARLIPRIYGKKRIKPKVAVVDCWPQSFDDVHFYGAHVGRELGLFARIQSLYGPSAIVTGIDDASIYHNPLYPYFSTNAAPPGLSFDQEQTQLESGFLSDQFAEFVNWYNAKFPDDKMKVIFMHPRILSKDFLVYDGKAEKELDEKIDGGVIDAPVDGNQGHSNSPLNAQAYRAALDRALAA
jgi:hypothetical protein